MKKENLGQKLNVLRAGVLGANDGIVSVAGTVLGVAGATNHLPTIMISGVASLVAGAFSMAGGEYVSVSTQRDTEKAIIVQEKQELKTNFLKEEQELAADYVEKGLSNELAQQVAKELMQKAPLEIHAKETYGIDPKEYVNPWRAALSSLVSFSLGALLPLIAILLLPSAFKIGGTFFIVGIALAITGYISSYLGEAPILPAVIRNCFVGMLTMIVTYCVGGWIGF
ncbi:VIT family protein [Vagococcus entomophilus]|uniref:VIT family protein n=1 Tax=Vagococcus entomophilus TaxID=1160095 RepID=A0A430AKZ2_9ENTE|nr:VIT family protein [Vagococcus entomophilus]RSU08736.1 hypothetical protein CBF30_05795 [Vagococcus entomophilus]